MLHFGADVFERNESILASFKHAPDLQGISRTIQGELESHLNIFHPNQYLTQLSHQLAIRTENINFTPHIFSRSFDHIHPFYMNP